MATLVLAYPSLLTWSLTMTIVIVVAVAAGALFDWLFRAYGFTRALRLIRFSVVALALALPFMRYVVIGDVCPEWEPWWLCWFPF